VPKPKPADDHEAEYKDFNDFNTMVKIGEKQYLGNMGIEAEKFKKKWKREKGNGNTSNEESDEKPRDGGYQSHGEHLLSQKNRRNSRLINT